MIKISPLNVSTLLVGSLAIPAMVMQPAQAITFNFAGLTQGSTLYNLGGISISDYNTSTSFPGTTQSPFRIDSGGIFLGQPVDPTIVSPPPDFIPTPVPGTGQAQSFRIAFNTSLLLTAYTITAADQASRFNLYRCSPSDCSNANLVFSRNVTRTQNGTFEFSTRSYPFINPDTLLEETNAGNVFGSETFNFSSGDVAIIRVTDQSGNALTSGKGFDVSNVEAVPWETDVLPLVGATILFGGGMWWKRRRAAASQLDLTGQEVDKESEA